MDTITGTCPRNGAPVNNSTSGSVTTLFILFTKLFETITKSIQLEPFEHRNEGESADLMANFE